jgi:hypothetical protein
MRMLEVKNILRVGVCVIMLAFLAMPALVPVMADDGGGEDPIIIVDDEGLDLGTDVVGGASGLGSGDLKTMIGGVIKAALGFLGVVAIVIVLIGGFKYMTAGGSDEKVGDAKKWIISGIIGLAIILAAYAITTFVIDSLLTATGADGTTNTAG